MAGWVCYNNNRGCKYKLKFSPSRQPRDAPTSTALSPGTVRRSLGSLSSATSAEIDTTKTSTAYIAIRFTSSPLMMAKTGSSAMSAMDGFTKNVQMFL